MTDKYTKIAVDKAVELLKVDSPSGFTKNASRIVKNWLDELGIKSWYTQKGGIIADLMGESDENPLLISAHIDTLGGMVAEIKANGRLRIVNIGGLNANNCEGENLRVYLRSGKVLSGTLQIINPSLHVNSNYNDTKRTFDTTEVVLDEDTNSKEQTKNLGVEVGDMVCFEPRTVITDSGYIKSRFLDDKLSVGILFALAKYYKDNNLTPKRHVYLHFTVFEEVGHGGSASIPCDVKEVIAVDMGCVGEGLNCTEKMVSICAKDSRSPYSYEVTGDLIAAAKKANLNYAVDIYPHYGSDADAALMAGADVRHGLIGPGVFASHGYERSHIEGVKNTLWLLINYLN